MYKLKILFVLCLSICALSGCSLSTQVEDQAYVLVMGLDRKTDHQLEMTVKLPKISGGKNEGGSGGESENYMQISVTANDFEGALEKLDWASPRNVNLSQLKLILVSQDLASESQFGKLIANIAQTERLFTATKVAVSEGSAKEFVNALQPYIGTRISTDIEEMFEYYNDQGYVPESSLADLYYQTESVYSDPMVSYALLDLNSFKKRQEQKEVPTFSSKGAQEQSVSYESEIPVRYQGAAVFSEGSLHCILNQDQTILVNLLRNELNSFRYENNGQSLELVPTRPVYLSVDTKVEPIRITANIQLSYAAQEKTPNESKLKSDLTNELISLIGHTQDIGVEPFGFAERAAKKFLTLTDWIDFNWKTHYANAKIEIKLRFAQSDA